MCRSSMSFSSLNLVQSSHKISLYHLPVYCVILAHSKSFFECDYIGTFKILKLLSTKHLLQTNNVGWITYLGQTAIFIYTLRIESAKILICSTYVVYMILCIKRYHTIMKPHGLYEHIKNNGLQTLFKYVKTWNL